MILKTADIQLIANVHRFFIYSVLIYTVQRIPRSACDIFR